MGRSGVGETSGATVRSDASVWSGVNGRCGVSVSTGFGGVGQTLETKSLRLIAGALHYPRQRGHGVARGRLRWTAPAHQHLPRVHQSDTATTRTHTSLSLPQLITLTRDQPQPCETHSAQPTFVSTRPSA